MLKNLHIKIIFNIFAIGENIYIHKYNMNIVIIYVLSLVILILVAIAIKEEGLKEDLAVCATIPILNTLLVIIFIGYAITQAMKDYKQHKIKKKIEQMPLYEFLNSKMQK